MQAEGATAWEWEAVIPGIQVIFSRMSSCKSTSFVDRMKVRLSEQPSSKVAPGAALLIIRTLNFYNNFGMDYWTIKLVSVVSR